MCATSFNLLQDSHADMYADPCSPR